MRSLSPEATTADICHGKPYQSPRSAHVLDSGAYNPTNVELAPNPPAPNPTPTQNAAAQPHEHESREYHLDVVFLWHLLCPLCHLDVPSLQACQKGAWVRGLRRCDEVNSLHLRLRTLHHDHRCRFNYFRVSTVIYLSFNARSSGLLPPSAALRDLSTSKTDWTPTPISPTPRAERRQSHTSSSRWHLLSGTP